MLIILNIDDEDTNDYRPSPVPKTEEHERFAKDKEEFKRKYKDQIDQLKFRWQKRQNEIQLLANRNATGAQQQYEMSEIDFRQEYEFLKQSASRERTRINELHEIHLDTALNNAKIEANKKLINAWNEKPLKVYYLLHHHLHINQYSLLMCQKDTKKNRGRLYLSYVCVYV